MTNLDLVKNINNSVLELRTQLNGIRELYSYINNIENRKYLQKTINIISIKLNTINDIISEFDTPSNEDSITLEILYKSINQMNGLVADIDDILDEIENRFGNKYSNDYGINMEFEFTIQNIKELNANLSSSIADFSNDRINYLYSKYSNSDGNNVKKEDRLVDYICLLSDERLNYVSQDVKNKLWNNYCNLVRDYCIDKYPYLKETISQDKPEIEITQIVENGDPFKVNARFSEKEDKIQLNYNTLCIHNPIKTAEAIRHELEHYYQAIVTEKYSENLKTHKDIYSNDVGFIYKSYKQYHKMSEDNIIKICQAIGKKFTTEYAESVKYAAYSMMRVEHLARNAQSEFKASIRSLIKRKRPNVAGDIWEFKKMPKEDIVKENDTSYKGYKETLDDFIMSITSNFTSFMKVIHEIDEQTLSAIFYAMSTQDKIDLRNKLIDKLNKKDLEEKTRNQLESKFKLLLQSIKYDEEIEQER